MESTRYRQLVSRLKLRHLRLIDAIASAGGVSAAAQDLRITQPAVSKGLREAEALFGATLFERGPYGLTITAMGQIVVAHGKVIQAELQSVSDQIEAQLTGTSGIISVGTSLVSRAKLLPRALRLMQEAAANTAVRLIDATEEMLIEWLREGTLDMMVGRLPPTDRDDGLTREILCQVPIVVVVGKNHLLAGRSDVTFADLAKASWIFPPPHSFVHASIMQVFAQIGQPRPRQYVESVSYLTVRTLLIENSMVAAMPQSVIEKDEEMGLIVRLPVALPQASLPVGIITRDDRKDRPDIALLTKCLRMAAQ
ncbi:MAG: LysR substrate-binding domain-containing protein [Pseudolabrys sp.]|jgi:DNA-binding transcriptional LysR family regulator